MRGVALWVALLAPAMCLADIVHLKDGQTLSGTVQRTPDGFRVTDDKGAVTNVPEGDVTGIEKVSKLTPEQQAAQALASLRHSCDILPDIKVIIQRFEAFITQHKGTAAAKEAEKDLDIWKDRLQQGMVKVGTTWVTPQERAQLFKQSFALIEQARAALRAGNFKQADAAIEQLLALDAKNASALYLRGLGLAMQDKHMPAKQVFDQVRAIMPDHSPTLNNIAVLLFRQKQYSGAMAIYSQAMIHNPRDRVVLDNVAEGLAGLPPEAQKLDQVQKAARLFKEQDSGLQQQLATQSLHRWGSAWLDDKQWAEIEKAQKEVKVKLDNLTAEFDKVRNRITAIEQEIQANNRAIERLEASRVQYDVNGNQVLRPRPDACYRIERDNDVLANERQQMIQRLGTFKEREAKIRATAPQPKYNGIQQLIGVEGTPLAAPPPAATQPSGG